MKNEQMCWTEDMELAQNIIDIQMDLWHDQDYDKCSQRMDKLVSENKYLGLHTKRVVPVTNTIMHVLKAYTGKIKDAKYTIEYRMKEVDQLKKELEKLNQKLQIAEVSGNSQELEKLKKENELQKLVNDRIT